MPRSKNDTPVGEAEPTLQPRDRIALVILSDWIAQERHHQSPSLRELMAALNQQLPKQANGKPALISTEQAERIAARLRREKLLEDEPGRHRNLYPTPLGEIWARKWRSKSGVTPKSSGRSNASAV